MQEGHIKKIKIGGVPEHFNLLWEMPAVKKMLLSRGLKAEFFEFPGGTGAMSEALKSGFLDGAVILTEGAVSEITRGCNYRIVCPFVQSPLFWGIFASSRSSITDLSDLGKRVFAISRFNSGSHLMAQYLAGIQGIKLGTENFYPANDLQGARNALAEGKAHLFLWEKYMTNPLVKSGEFRMVGELKAPWNSFVLVLRTDLAEKRPWLIRELKDCVIEAGKLFKNLKGAPRKIAEKYGIDERDARKWFSEVIYYQGEDFKAGITVTAEILYRYRITDKIVDFSKLVFEGV